MDVIHTRVFELKQGGGNPCPVVLDADYLCDKQMQKMAADFGVETAFVVRPTSKGADYRLRYFVPKHEMEMCIHATVGVVTVLVKKKGVTKSPLQIETPLGVISVRWEMVADQIRVRVMQFPPKFFKNNPLVNEVAQVLNISKEDLALNAPVQTVSTSRPKLIIPLKNEETLSHLQPNFQGLWELCNRYHITGFYPYSVVDHGFVSARQFPDKAGYNEDPATGVAACALGAYLVEHQVFKRKQGWNAFRIKQGETMGSPSIIFVRVYYDEGNIKKTEVSGNARIVNEK
ncbi:PhzF family phenazine biosynthesis protein [Melghirimyces algeriensis]|uniref:Phenazine biosynthesis protein PhzF family n=1 Tax=Melghirimyces algeriensis TaxID=910412 RepID=A0A521EXV0_9BACL|nr:PhzF family phenazine biosynthesis protein [Melghirimyces algeriensis]SMO88764.1 phenazine biosynthesis protein PhzF family [Melghirimyces algeriensis]